MTDVHAHVRLSIAEVSERGLPTTQACSCRQAPRNNGITMPSPAIASLVAVGVVFFPIGAMCDGEEARLRAAEGECSTALLNRHSPGMPMTFVARCWVRPQASHRAAALKYAGSRTLQHFTVEASMQTLGICWPRNERNHVFVIGLTVRQGAHAAAQGGADRGRPAPARGRRIGAGSRRLSQA